MKNIGEPRLIVGLNVIRDRSAGTITLTQEKYVNELLVKFRMENAKPMSTSADYSTVLTKDMCPKTEKERQLMANYPYRELVGSLMYLSVGVRPDVSYAVSEL